MVSVVSSAGPTGSAAPVAAEMISENLAGQVRQPSVVVIWRGVRVLPDGLVLGRGGLQFPGQHLVLVFFRGQTADAQTGQHPRRLRRDPGKAASSGSAVIVRLGGVGVYPHWSPPAPPGVIVLTQVIVSLFE